MPSSKSARRRPRRAGIDLTRSGISIVIPAHNEAACLPACLASVQVAIREWGGTGEIVVVNNASTDATAEIARSLGAKVVDHPTRNISSVRNAGIRAATQEWIVTIDADCLLPRDALQRIAAALDEPGVIGGALGLRLLSNNIYKRVLASALIGLVGLLSGMNGAMFFFRRGDALAFGGFREDLLIAEDRAFAADFRRLARAQEKKFMRLSAVKVATHDRKDISLRSLLSQMGAVLRAVAGKKQTIEELGYWYRPKR